MANSLVGLLRRDGPDDHEDDPPIGGPIIGLIVTLLVLIFVGLMVIAALLFLRRRRRLARMENMNFSAEKRLSTSTTSSRGDHVSHEKQALMEESEEIPDSPIPEIRVHLPEEVDDSGKRQAGRVVTVHVGETGVGYEPSEGPPAYDTHQDERFQSIDLERVGGLEEKPLNSHSKSWK